MRKVRMLAAMTALCALFSGMGAAPAAADVTTLTYSNFFPPTHIQSQLAEAWCKEVEERTEGRVVIQYFAGQTLAKADQTYDAVLGGIADIGFSVMAYTRGRFPVMSAVDLPLGYTSGRMATDVINKVYAQFAPKELDDTQVMYLHAHGPGLIHTKDRPVRKLEDMKGLKFRAHGTSARVVSALGGTPVPKPMPESYQMLQKGVVDGSVYPMESNKGWKLGDVTDYCTAAFSAAYTTSFFVAMNKGRWNSLSEKDRKIISEINAEWAVKHGEAWDESDMAGIRYFLNQGNEIIGLSEKEAARWAEAVAPIIEEYMKELDGKGFDGRQIIDFIKQAQEQPR